MSKEQINITDMQCRIYRMAQRKWNITPTDCTILFQKYNIFRYISDCYDTLHLSSYECALHDVEEILKSNGVNICKN
jgi:hypothetical protein